MMLRVAPAADAVRALFVGRKRMGATILRWLMLLIHLIWKQPVIPAQAGISVPLPTHCRRREIPAFGGMTVGEQARRPARRPRLRSTTEPYSVRIYGGDRSRAHAAGAAFRSHLRRTFRTFRAGFGTWDYR